MLKKYGGSKTLPYFIFNTRDKVVNNCWFIKDLPHLSWKNMGGGVQISPIHM